MPREQRLVGLVEDDPVMGESLVQRLTLDGIGVKWWQDGETAVKAIAGSRFDAIVCDIRLPDMNGEQFFTEAARSGTAAPFMFITGQGDIDQAVRLMRAGARDYVTKPFDMDRFLARLAEIFRPQQSIVSDALGYSQPAKEMAHLIERLAPLPSTVLLTGETGSGKEVAARFLHATSPRSDKPFIAVNCAAIPSELMESELFGHERGAFTSASQRHVGYAERSGTGILFLDEIGDMRLELQAKLLRLLEERKFSRVGGEAALPFNGRLIAATNQDLFELVQKGRFREDLYYRINVVTVEVPSLRARRDDIPWLMNKFLNEFSATASRDIRCFSALAEQAALHYPWPGNVRELRNRVERAVALGLDECIMPGDLFPATERSASRTNLESLEDVRQDAERRHILRALQNAGGEIGTASKILGIGRTTLWEKMRRLGLSTDTQDSAH
ncbi:MAG: sigma-54 dependent transcriptional regulator [Xanthobacteraceae bacterium]|nr:sigma-54 dependent transcriptional regulator [Xanthobacteraceae bacterium]